MNNELKCKNCGLPRQVGRAICRKCNAIRVCKYYLIRGKQVRENKNKKSCLVCKNSFTQWRKKQVICPTCYKKSFSYSNTTNKYVYTSISKKALHRHIAENIIGRKLSYNEVVHHVDENPKNNKLDNLWVMSRFLHGKLHIFLRLQRAIWEQSQNENRVNCWDNLRVAQTTAWLETTGAKVLKLSELVNQQPSSLNGKGSETKDVTSNLEDDIVQTTTIGLGN